MYLSDVFISYHWRDSHSAAKEGQVTSFTGSKYSDARRLAQSITKEGAFKKWLDIESLSKTSGKSVYEQHALAIRRCRVFMAFVSDQYAASMFCRMQFQFACGFAEKIVIPIIVGGGEGNDGGDGAGAVTSSWKSSVIGMTVDGDKERFQVFDMSTVDSDIEYSAAVGQILIAVKNN